MFVRMIMLSSTLHGKTQLRNQGGSSSTKKKFVMHKYKNIEICVCRLVQIPGESKERKVWCLKKCCALNIKVIIVSFPPSRLFWQ